MLSTMKNNINGVDGVSVIVWKDYIKIEIIVGKKNQFNSKLLLREKIFYVSSGERRIYYTIKIKRICVGLNWGRGLKTLAKSLENGDFEEQRAVLVKCFDCGGA
jgi:hypothetical protein